MDYEPGQSIQFADSNATVSDDVAGISTGTVNGPPIKDDDGNTLLVPAFTERDNGREATTVYVAVENILAWPQSIRGGTGMNVLVDVRGTVDVSEDVLVELLGRPAEDTDAWYEEACEAAERKCDGDPHWALDHLTGGDLEFDAS